MKIRGKNDNEIREIILPKYIIFIFKKFKKFLQLKIRCYGKRH